MWLSTAWHVIVEWKEFDLPAGIRIEENTVAMFTGSQDCLLPTPKISWQNSRNP